MSKLASSSTTSDQSESCAMASLKKFLWSEVQNIAVTSSVWGLSWCRSINRSICIFSPESPSCLNSSARVGLFRLIVLSSDLFDQSQTLVFQIKLMNGIAIGSLTMHLRKAVVLIISSVNRIAIACLTMAHCQAVILTVSILNWIAIGRLRKCQWILQYQEQRDEISHLIYLVDMGFIKMLFMRL